MYECDSCGGHNVRVIVTDDDMRFCRCRDCGWEFRPTDDDDDDGSDGNGGDMPNGRH